MISPILIILEKIMWISLYIHSQILSHLIDAFSLVLISYVSLFGNLLWSKLKLNWIKPISTDSMKKWFQGNVITVTQNSKCELCSHYKANIDWEFIRLWIFIWFRNKQWNGLNKTTKKSIKMIFVCHGPWLMANK